MEIPPTISTNSDRTTPIDHPILDRMVTFPPVLMSVTHEKGWRLEDLLGQLQIELDWKCQKIQGDPRPAARAVLAHNRQILAQLMLMARAIVLLCVICLSIR